MKSNKIANIALFLALFGVSLNAQEDSLTFSRAYEMALINSNSIKALSLKAEASVEKVNQQESALYPQIALSASYQKSDNIFNQQFTTSATRRIQGLTTYTATLRQSLYSAEIYSKIAAEESRSKLGELEVELKKEELAQSVFRIYLDILKSKNKIALSEAFIKYNKSRLDELTKRYEMNLANKMDLLEMRVEYNSAQIDLRREEKILHVNELKLSQIIGEDPQILPNIRIDRLKNSTIENLKNSIAKGDNFDDNLYIMRAQLALKLSKNEVQTASDGHLPTLNLDASAATYETDNPNIQTPFKRSTRAMVVLNIPVYSGGQVSSRVAETRLMSKSALEELLEAKKDAKVQFDEYKALFDTASESVELYKDAYESAKLFVNSVEQGYEHGLKSVIDLNEAKSKLYEVKYKYVENIYEMVDSYIGLLIVTNNFESISLLDELVR